MYALIAATCLEGVEETGYPIKFAAAAAACLSALKEFMYGYDLEPLLSYKSKKIYFSAPALKFHSWVAFPSLQGTLSLCGMIRSLCCDSNLIHILPIYTVTVVVFPPALPCLSLQQLTNDLFLCSFLVWTPLCSQCRSVYCVFGSSEIYALLYGSSSLRRELNNGPNIHTDADLACLMIDFLTQWLTEGNGLLNLQSILCCLCIKPLSALITLKAFMLADYSQMNGLDLVMVHFFCSPVQEANKSIPSTPWYSEDVLIALSAALLIKASG